MNQSKAEAMVAQLLTNAAGLRHGTVSVSVKLHDGRVVQVMYSTTENIKDSKPEAEDGTNQE
jgi:hypothetical protein